VALTRDFPDHFSGVAGAYATFRPRYPAALFAFLSQHAPHHDHAWDCATGNGQAALGLAEHFTAVTATDASAAQIAAALPHPRVTYRVAPAERSGLPAGSVSVAQALHWLDRPAFYAEARRVAGRGGLIAAWCYGRMTVAPAIDRIIGRYYEETVGSYWPPERRLVEEGYRTIEFPFAPLNAPPFEIAHGFTLAELGGYLGTWSATRAYIERHGTDPVPEVLARLRELWGRPEVPRPARFPLALRVGRC
jgi:methyltransferase family protein